MRRAYTRALIRACLTFGLTLTAAGVGPVPSLGQPAPGESLNTSPAAIYTIARAFNSGERLRYELFWFSIPAGSAVMEVTDADSIDGRPSMKLLSTAKSGALLSKFYPVENHLESVIDPDALSPQRMIFHRREGRKKNDFDLTFHHAQGTVHTIKDGHAEDIAIPPGTQDILSCLYYLRNLPSLAPGTTVTLNVHHDKKNYRLEVRVEGVEKMASPWGKVDAVRVLAIMPFQGIFLNQGHIRVWLPNDVRRIPLAMKAKVIVGSVTARLVNASGVASP